MKNHCILSIIISYLIYIIKCNAEQAYFDRNFKTLKFILSKYQHYPTNERVNAYSFFTIHLSNITFFPSQTSQMQLKPLSFPTNHMQASKIILTFYSNLTLILRETPKRLHENNFIIEIIISDLTIATRTKLNKMMTFVDINSFLVHYSSKRNFLISKRFEEFKQVNTLNFFIRKIIQGYKFLFDEYNYYHIDFEEINASMKTMRKKTINININETTVLENYFYSSYLISDCKINKNDKTLNANNYSIIVAYDLNIEDKVKNLSLRIIFPFFIFSYNENSFGSPAFGLDKQDDSINHYLLEIFKVDFEKKTNEYYKTFQ